MVNTNNKETAEKQEDVGQSEVLQEQLGSVLTGVERTLAVTCESIMGKMKQLEDKIQDMEKRYTDLVKDIEGAGK